MEREKLSSRLGFILLSAGCAIGCGNVWKFPWMCGQNGGGAFVLVYIICLLVLGLPVMTMEFSLGRASQKSPVQMYKALEGKGQKWHLHGYIAFFGNLCLMAFYTVVTGWFFYYFIKFVLGQTSDEQLGFVSMISDPGINVVFMLIAIVIGFGILCFDLQKGLEKVTKIMMVALLILLLVLCVNSLTLSGAKEGLEFYLFPKLENFTSNTIVSAMNQAFFTLSLGIGSMAIFGSYIGKERSLMGESVHIIVLDTLVALLSGLIIFPACASYDIEVGAGPALLFESMRTVFNNMTGGRIWGSLFFLFMIFAALSTELAVFENILACFREMTGFSRPKGALVCGIIVALMSTTTALGYSVISFEPFAEGSAFLDFWDFILSNNLLPLGCLVITLFCTIPKFGWGWDNFVKEANAGKGLKVQNWMRPIFTFVVPIIILFIYVYGLITYQWN